MRRDSAYLRFLFLHFTVHGAVRLGPVGPGLNKLPDGVRGAGFYVFYNSIFSIFCPLWSSETTLGGLRMVRSAAWWRDRTHKCAGLLRRPRH